MKKIYNTEQYTRRLLLILFMLGTTILLSGWIHPLEPRGGYESHHLIPILLLLILSVIVTIAGVRYNRRDYDSE